MKAWEEERMLLLLIIIVMFLKSLYGRNYAKYLRWIKHSPAYHNP